MTRTQTNRPLGAWGENAAAAHLALLGWQVLDRNWRCPAGELDIVAREPDGTLVFVEVKCRSGLGFGEPIEAITHAKVAKLRELAQHWLATHPHRCCDVRIDAIGVLRDPRTGPHLTHVRGITR